jgi:hypothetical protein
LMNSLIGVKRAVLLTRAIALFLFIYKHYNSVNRDIEEKLTQLTENSCKL